MSKRKKRLTRKQKRAMNPNSSGNSKYAKKIKARVRLAAIHSLPADTPLPAIWASIER